MCLWVAKIVKVVRYSNQVVNKVADVLTQAGYVVKVGALGASSEITVYLGD